MEWDYLSRILYGTSKVVTEYIQAGQSYRHIRKIISVSIVFFNLGRGEDYVYHGTTEFRGTHQHDVLQLGENEQKAYGPEKTTWGCGRKPPEFPDNFCSLILIYEPLTSKLNRLM